MIGDLKIKSSAGKVPLALVPLSALEGLARVIEHGNGKYGLMNWRKAELNRETVLRYLSACQRHLKDVQEGVLQGSFEGAETGSVLCPDASGLPHLDHAIASLVLLRDIINQKFFSDPGQHLYPQEAP